MTWSRIEITGGMVSAPVRKYCGNLAGLDFMSVGERLFFVEAVEADGGRIILHDGFSYPAAVTVAEEVARPEGIPIHDLASEGLA